MTWSLYICQDFKDNVSQSGQKRKWCPFNFSSCIQECWRLSVSCFPFILRKNAVSLSPPVINVCGRFWEKPLPSDCFMTKCVFSRMCPSSHVLSHLLGELTQRHEHSQTCTKTHWLVCASWPMHTLSLSVIHTHMNSLEARRGVWLGQKWTHAGIRAAVCDSHFSLSLSFNLSLLALSYHWHPTPTSPCSLYPPVSLKTWVFQMYSAHKLIRELFLNL